jgi:hypothetical protein
VKQSLVSGPVTFFATAIVVLVASPADTMEERAAVQLGLSRWNVDRGEREGAVVIPWLYEQHAVPMLGGHAQSIINTQAVSRADVVVAFFDARLGTETPEAVSGTAEEITRAHRDGKPVHVYFSNEAVERESIDPEQLRALADFKTTLSSEGLLGSYENPQHLASQVVSAIDYDVNVRDWGATVRKLNSSGAVLKARHIHNKEFTGTNPKGKAQYRTTANQLILLNDGDRTAETVRVTAQALSGSIHFDEPEPFDLTPGSEVGFVMIGNGTANVKVDLAWMEDGQERTSSQTITVGLTG